jgi:hypothetical protein
VLLSILEVAAKFIDDNLTVSDEILTLVYSNFISKQGAIYRALFLVPEKIRTNTQKKGHLAVP